MNLQFVRVIWLSFIAVLVVVADVSQAAELRPLQGYEARYIVERGDSVYGEASRKLELTSAGQFDLYTETEISWLFISDRRRFWATFAFTDARVKPISFAYKRSGTGRDKSFSAEFSPLQQQIINSSTQQPLAIEWQPDLLDEASMLEQLRFDVMNTDAETFSYRLLDEKGNVDVQIFRREAEQQLQLPYGDVIAVKVVRVRENSDRETEFWFAPELEYVMVMMQQREEGEEVATLRLEILEQAE